MNRVNDWLWIGDASDGRDHVMLLGEGITHVFNATRETDGWPPHFKERTPYLRLDQDDGQPIPPEKLDQFAAWLIVQGWSPIRLLVHCGAGVSRAATFAALTLMLQEGAIWSAALETLRKVRPQVAPNPALVDSVRSWWLARGGRAEALV